MMFWLQVTNGIPQFEGTPFGEEPRVHDETQKPIQEHGTPGAPFKAQKAPFWVASGTPKGKASPCVLSTAHVQFFATQVPLASKWNPTSTTQEFQRPLLMYLQARWFAQLQRKNDPADGCFLPSNRPPRARPPRPASPPWPRLARRLHAGGLADALAAPTLRGLRLAREAPKLGKDEDRGGKFKGGGGLDKMI